MTRRWKNLAPLLVFEEKLRLREAQAQLYGLEEHLDELLLSSLRWAQKTRKGVGLYQMWMGEEKSRKECPGALVFHSIIFNRVNDHISVGSLCFLHRKPEGGSITIDYTLS